MWALELPEEARTGAEGVQHPAGGGPGDLDRAPESGAAPRTVQLSDDQEAHYPKSLQKEFRGRRFATEDPRLLDYEGAQVIFIGAREDPEKAYQIDLQPEHETERSADIFKQLRLARSRHPVEPLLRGEWR